MTFLLMIVDKILRIKVNMASYWAARTECKYDLCKVRYDLSKGTRGLSDAEPLHFNDVSPRQKTMAC